jgi:hypothetical protein
MIHKNFDQYSVQYLSDGGASQATPMARIACYQTGAPVGELLFYRGQIPDSTDSLTPEGILQLRYTLDRFRDVLALIQFEKPLQLLYHPETKQGSVASCLLEPVGEQEGKSST